MNKKRPTLDADSNLKILSTMDISPKTKHKLQAMARLWIQHIKSHSEDIKHPFQNMYHKGEISFIEFFFLSDVVYYKPKPRRKTSSRRLHR